jgi:mono/diheme cytochrome c family protein
MHEISVVLPAALLGAIALVPPDAARGEDKSAGAVFRARCAACHTVPDPALRTDRAWLDQINRTA